MYIKNGKKLGREMDRWLRKPRQLTSVDLADGGHSDRRPDVDVPGHRRAPRVVPVLVVGSQLLHGRGLDDIDPLGKLHLARPESETFL
jgi:hypothetical protein